jgi:hypothetical protein
MEGATQRINQRKNQEIKNFQHTPHSLSQINKNYKRNLIEIKDRKNPQHITRPNLNLKPLGIYKNVPKASPFRAGRGQ